MSQKSVKPYVRALFDLANESKALDPVHQDLLAVGRLIKDSEDFASFLQNTSISLPKQMAVLKDIFVKFNPLTLSFLLYMAKQNRLDRLPDLSEQFDSLYFKNAGILKVKIVAPIALGAEQVERISRKLSESFKSKIQAGVEVDPSLIGGFQVHIGDLIQDFSIKTQLERFKQSVLTA